MWLEIMTLTTEGTHWFKYFQNYATYEIEVIFISASNFWAFGLSSFLQFDEVFLAMGLDRDLIFWLKR
jgi:hypothetical protein